MLYWYAAKCRHALFSAPLFFFQFRAIPPCGRSRPTFRPAGCSFFFLKRHRNTRRSSAIAPADLKPSKGLGPGWVCTDLQGSKTKRCCTSTHECSSRIGHEAQKRSSGGSRFATRGAAALSATRDVSRANVKYTTVQQ